MKRHRRCVPRTLTRRGPKLDLVLIADGSADDRTFAPEHLHLFVHLLKGEVE